MDAETSIKLLSDWGNSLTKALESVGQYLADFTMFTHLVTRPLLHQLADQAANSAPIVQRIVSQSDAGSGEKTSNKSSAPKIVLPRLSSLECNFDDLPPVAPTPYAGNSLGALYSAVKSSPSFSPQSRPISPAGTTPCRTAVQTRRTATRGHRRLRPRQPQRRLRPRRSRRRRHRRPRQALRQAHARLSLVWRSEKARKWHL